MDTRLVVVFRAEAGAESPFWTFAREGLDYGFFALSPDLVARMRDWCERVWHVSDESERGDAWLSDGRTLYDEAARAMAARYELAWDPDNDDLS